MTAPGVGRIAWLGSFYFSFMIVRHQSEHERINAREYPGTRQICVRCDSPTERCEEDAIHTEDGDGPLCVECWHKTPEYQIACLG